MSPVADPSGTAGDSAGVPWAGRTLTGQPFAGDDGTTDAGLLTALAGWRDRADRAALTDVVRAWAPTRVLVPIVAVLGEDDDLSAAADHGQGDKSADMALVTITGRDGRRILPAFSSTAALASWNATARPVPVEAARAAQAAVLEGCDLIAIDPAGPVECLLPRPVVWAVAQGRDWLPPAEDPEVLAAVAAIAATVPGLVAHRCEPDGLADLNVVLGLPVGLDPDQVQQIAGRMSQLLAGDDLVAERTESLRLTVRPV
jgi:type III secretion system (T3SS) SseB-like protein